MTCSRTVRALIAIVLYSLSAAASSYAAKPQTGNPTGPAVKLIHATLIAKLANADPTAREEAATALRARGQAVVPALEAAVHCDSPSIALAARSVLRDIEADLSPALQPDFTDFVKHYRDAEDIQKATVPYKIADSGAAGLRAVLGLYRQTHDPNLLDSLTEHRHEAAVLMLGVGMDADAERMIGPPSEDEAPNAHRSLGDPVAFLLTTGKIAAARAEFPRQPLTRANAGRRYMLDRADGDLHRALADAQQIPNWPKLLDEILVRQHDWRTLSERLEADSDELFSDERLGFLCRFEELMGDPDAARRTARRLAAETEVDFQKGGVLPLNAAHELFMCGFPDQAIDVLIGHRELAQASWYLPARLRFEESLTMVDTARAQLPAELDTARSNSAKALRFMGRVPEARKIIEEEESVDAAHDCGFVDLEEKLAVQILSRSEYRDPKSSQMIFYSLGVEDWVPASLWFGFLRRHYGDKNLLAVVRDVRQTLDGTIASNALARLGRAALQETVDDGSPEQSDRLAGIGEILSSHKCADVAAGFFSRVEHSANSADALRRAGDFKADRGNWDVAQDDYALAFELDPLQAAPLYLRGWALSHLGLADEGKDLMDRAEVLPLCDAEQRKKLLDAMIRHNLLSEARHEVGRIVALNGSGAYESTEAVRWAAHDARDRKDFPAAASLLLDSFLPMQENGAGFLQPLASMEVPAMIHQVNAEAMLTAGHIGPAIAEAKAALALAPLDPDLPVELVKLFADSGDKVEADELYREQAAVYRGLIDRYHESGSARHLLASMQLRCHRDLTDAQEFAAAAVAFEPENPVFVETLSEVDFARGDVKGAANHMRRCVELQPDSAHYRQQLAVYESARRDSK